MPGHHFYLRSPAIKERAAGFVLAAPDEWELILTPPVMNQGQRARFHAMCSDIARSGLEWGGKRRTAHEWKVLVISGHAVATKEDVEVVTGLEGELVNVRESTTSMSRSRGASLIEYVMAFCAASGVRLRAPEPKN